jgi:hypothetical protein
MYDFEFSIAARQQQAKCSIFKENRADDGSQGSFQPAIWPCSSTAEQMLLLLASPATKISNVNR